MSNTALAFPPTSAAGAADTVAGWYRGEFERNAERLAGSGPQWLTELRRKAIDGFEARGFPTTRDEDWHFTSVAPIAERRFGLAPPDTRVSPAEIIRTAFGNADWDTLVFVNGRHSPELSNVTGGPDIVIESLAAVLRRGDPLLERHLGTIAPAGLNAFAALNTAFAEDGAFIRIPAGRQSTRPVHLVFVAAGAADDTVSHVRNLIVAERESRATILESYVTTGDTRYFTNCVSEVLVGEAARLSHYRIQREGRRAFHVSTSQARQARNSYYESFSFATGGDLSRANIYTVLEENAAECVLNGLYLVDGSQHVDHQTYVEHVAPNCPSHELYKGILDGRSHGVFNGKVYVHPEAQKTDGKQSNNNLLLSDTARVDTKPQLEIFADDVRCTHGATVGRLDETALFYLRSRGVGMAAAKKLLTYAFAADVLERIELAPLRETLEAHVLARFTGESS